MKDKQLTIQDVLDYAENDLRERISYEIEVNNYTYEDDDGEMIHDMIHEIADNEIPIYYTQLLEVCMSDISILTEPPEMECDSAVSCIQTNIFTEIYNVLDARKNDIYDEIKKNNKPKGENDE